MLSKTDFNNGNIDIYLLNNLEKYGSECLLNLLIEYEENIIYEDLLNICLRYFKIYYIENIFSKEDIFSELFNLILKNKKISANLFPLDNNEFINMYFLNLYDSSISYNQKIILYNFILDLHNVENLELKTIKNSFLGIIFLDNIDYLDIHSYLKKIFLNKKIRILIFEKIYQELTNIKKDNNSFQIVDAIKSLDDSKLDSFINHLKIFDNILQVFLIFWEKGINQNRLKEISEEYYNIELAKTWQQNNENKDYTFLTHCFYLIHFILNNIFKSINEFNMELNKAINELSDYLPFLEINVDIINKRKDKLSLWKKNFNEISLVDDKKDKFFKYSNEWLYIKEKVSEELVENIIDYNIINLKNNCRNSQVELFLKMNQFNINPHIKKKIINLLFHDFIDKDKYITNHDKFILELVKYYIQMEEELEFYDKFFPRYQIICLFNYFLRNKESYNYYKYELQTIDEKSTRFLFLILNDCHFFFEELLTNIKKLKKHEAKLNEEDLLKPAELVQVTSIIKNYLAYSYEYLILIDFLSNEKMEYFIKKEITDKLAIFLDYVLSEFAGKKTAEINIKSPEKYNFKPINILSLLANIYINLGYNGEIIKALSNDRLYEETNFNKMISVLIKKDVYGSNTWYKTGLLYSIRDKIKNYNETNIDYDSYDPPIELCDPLMTTLIEEPIKLPDSDIIMDKNIIIKHLLSNETNPFNRSKLTPSMLLEYNKKPEIIEEIKQLKQKIILWKKNLKI